MFNKIRQRLAKFFINSMSLPNSFLKYGNQGRMSANWTEVLMTDKDLYTGYAYGAVKNRASYTARVASEHLRTDSDVEGLEHPYCDLIWNSKTFSEFSFWYTISTYLDLEGVFYLMSIRNFDGKSRYGTAKEFKLLNPYDVRRVVDSKTNEVTGYVESRNGLVREIPPSMIIEMRALNPFDWNEPYSMTDAAKESQFTLKGSADYTRNAIHNNINAPGILTTDVYLDEPNFENFKNRVKNNVKGEPIFGNGSGAITYQSMTQDLSKAGLKDINEINRDSLLSAAGMSKTMMSIEQSGVTRDTARVQKDLFIEGQILPQIQLIIDALNLDYRNNYPNEYAKGEPYLMIDNPQEVDQAAEKTGAEVKKIDFELFQSMVDKGYNPKKVAAFIDGQIELEDLGKPKKVEQIVTEPLVQPPAETQPVVEKIKKKVNQLPTEDTAEIENQRGNLKVAVVNVEHQLVAICLSHIEKNEYDEESDVITKQEKNSLIEELAITLAAFYTVIFQSKGRQTMLDREDTLGLPGLFKFDSQSKKYVKQVSVKVAKSHIDTVTKEILKVAREAALEGLSQQEIISRVRQTFTTDISTKRAEVVARTETNRAFTMAQYDADVQFIKQNDLDGKAYKRWRTRSANPCPFCKSLEDEGLIPFDTNFRDLGETVTVGKGKEKKTLEISFESLKAGNAHPNCSCIYELVIK